MHRSLLNFRQIVLFLTLVSSIFYPIHATKDDKEGGTDGKKILRYIAKFKGPDEREAFRNEKDAEDLILKSIPRSESEVLIFQTPEEVAEWEESHTNALDYFEEGKKTSSSTIIDV